MSKIVIDDAMVRRAAKELRGLRPLSEDENAARRILTAALSEPKAFERPVPKHVTQAGLWAFYAEISGDVWRSEYQHQNMARAYRAMAAAARKNRRG